AHVRRAPGDHLVGRGQGEGVDVRPQLDPDPVVALAGRTASVDPPQRPSGEAALVGTGGGGLARVAVDDVRDAVDAGGVERPHVRADERRTLAGLADELTQPAFDGRGLLAVGQLARPGRRGVLWRDVL